MMKRLPTLALLAVSILAFCTFAWWEQDDFYIHLQYVRNLLADGEWSYTPGTPSYGTTSPLWILVVSLPGLLGVPLPLAAKGLSIGFAVGCVFLLMRARTLFRHPAIHAAAVLTLLADHWFRLASGSGMEASMTAFLALALGLSLLTQPRPTPLNMAAYGALSGLLILSRPEFFVLPAILLFAPRASSPSAWLKGYAVLLFVLALVVVPWLWYALVHFGSIAPNTIALKIASSAKAPLTFVNILKALARQVFFFGTMYAPGLLAMAASAIVLLRSRRTIRPALPLAVWGLIFFLPAMYVVIQARGGEGISYRYAAPVLPLLVLAGYRLMDQGLASANRKLVSLAVTASVVWSLGAGVALSIAHTPSLKISRAYLNDTLVSYGRWLNQNTPPTALIGCYDVGAIAYYSRRPVLDLVGLNNPEVIPLIDPNERPRVNRAAIMKYRPDYLVSFAHGDTGQLYDGVPIVETLLTREVQPFRFGSRAQAGESHPCHLWRLDWTGLRPTS